MNVLVTGVTGYVGSCLVPRLKHDGHMVRGFARRPSELEIPLVLGDAVSGDGLDQALDGIEVAYFLIHSMERSPDGPFSARERAAAENFADAARAAGVKRIIYLGGLLPSHGPASPHLASRLEVEKVLGDASPCTVSFRASIVIGARSRSFRFLVRLVERLPVLAVPAWGTHRTAPIDERDVVELLTRAARGEPRALRPLARRRRSRRRLLRRADRPHPRAHARLPSNPRLSRISVTPIASRIAAAIAGEDPDLIGPLMESLGEDLLPRDDRAAELLGVRLHSLDAAIERSLREWEATEPLAAR